MKKLFSVVIALLVILLTSVAYADTITVGDIEIEYNSLEDLQAIYGAIKERMASDYKTVLFDADTYDAATYIVGETFPAGRYLVYPVVVSEANIEFYPILAWWDKTEIDNYSCTSLVRAHWYSTVELTDGMKIEFSWIEDQRDVFIAMQLVPSAQTNLMGIFE